MGKIKEKIIEILKKWDNSEIENFLEEILYFKRYSNLKKDFPRLFEIYNTYFKEED